MKSPLNITWKSEIVSLVSVAASIAVSALCYSRLPERVISHWNFAGQADGWSSRNFHVFFFPSMLVGMYLLFLILPSIDPKKERYVEFVKIYNIFRSMIVLIFLAIYLVATLVNIGYSINVGLVVPSIIGLMMIVMGNYMGKIKNNWFMGIRTPWTLSSENVWIKTHRLGGLMFVLFGIILILTPWMPQQLGMAAFITGILCVTIVPMAASYFFYKNEK